MNILKRHLFKSFKLFVHVPPVTSKEYAAAFYVGENYA